MITFVLALIMLMIVICLIVTLYDAAPSTRVHRRELTASRREDESITASE